MRSRQSRVQPLLRSMRSCCAAKVPALRVAEPGRRQVLRRVRTALRVRGGSGRARALGVGASGGGRYAAPAALIASGRGTRCSHRDALGKPAVAASRGRRRGDSGREHAVATQTRMATRRPVSRRSQAGQAPGRFQARQQLWPERRATRTAPRRRRRPGVDRDRGGTARRKPAGSEPPGGPAPPAPVQARQGAGHRDRRGAASSTGHRSVGTDRRDRDRSRHARGTRWPRARRSASIRRRAFQKRSAVRSGHRPPGRGTGRAAATTAPAQDGHAGASRKRAVG